MSDVGTAISPVSFWVPDYICPSSAWIEHAPFAFWLCEALRPRRFIELGSHHGYSYFAFCQAIDRLGLGTTAYAVDTWKGDEHAGFYDESVFHSVVTRNNEKFSAFSSPIRSTFEDALDYFADGSVDLLHIDGRHLYNDVMHDFTRWRPKLTQDAVVLFHDTNVREREFGVWKFFEKVATQHPSFQFFHGYGLGLLIPGDRVPAPLAPLIEASREAADHIRTAYAALGGALTVRTAFAGLAERHLEIEAQNTANAQSLGEIEALKGLIATIVSERDEALAGLAERHLEIEAQNTANAQSLGEIEALKSLIATIVSERDEALAGLAERHREIEAQNTANAQSLGEIEALKGLIATIVSERDEALAGLAERHREIEAQDTAHAQSLGKIEALKALIATTISERDKAVADLAAALEVLMSSRTSLADAERSTSLLLAERNGALAEMSRRGEEVFAALQSAEAKLAKRDDALSRAERELSDRNTEAVALASEIIKLRSDLAAARDVGRATLAALRSEPGKLRDAPRNPNWLTAAFGRFGFRARRPLPLG